MKRLKGMLKLRKKKTAEPELLRPSSDPAVELPLSACASSLASDGAYVVRRKELGQLHRAAVDGNMGDLLRLVYKHDINEPDKDSRTPLHLACANGYTDIVTFLVDHKCHLNLCDNEGRTPLMKAVQCQQEFCAIYLLEHGADSNILDIHNNTALHFAASNSSLSITKHLLEHKADIEAQNEDGSTPLIVAVIENNREMVEFLLEKGASVHATDNLGRTPLLTAAADKKRDLTNILLRHGSDVFHRDGSGWSAKEYGLNSGDAILLQYIAEYSSLKNREEDSPDDQKVLSVLSCPETAGDAGIMLGAPATNKEVTDDHSFGDSVRDSGKTDNDSWLSSEDEELDFSPKKPQKPSLAQIINISQQFKKTIYEKSSVIRPEHTAISQQNKSNYEAEDLNESFPTPLLQVQSLPRPVQSSPDSFSKCPQMTSNLDSKQGESSEEDDEQEDDDEEENRKISDVVDKNLIYNESSEKPSQDGGVKRAALTSGMNGGEEENVAESPWDSEPKFDKANLEHDANLHLLKGMETREKQKSDLMEELGLDGADDIEDASDWDSASISLKIVPSAKPLNLLMGEGASPLQLATRDDATKTPVTVRAEFSDVRIISASEDQQCNKQKGIKEFERDQKQVEEEKRKQKWEEVEAAGKKETANIEKKLTVNIVQKMEQNPLENEKQHIKIDGEIAEESQVMDIISSADRKRLIPVSFKEKNLIAKVKDVGKSENKSWLSTQRTSQEITENLHQLQDDSSLSEASMKEERHSARAVSEKNKIYRAMRIINDFDDLTQSSDTATEDIEFPTLVYKDAMMLIEQLSLDSKADSVSLLKIQNIFHEYESLIEHERGHSIHLQEKVKKNENEKKEQQRILEDMREMKSTLDHQKVERESIISSLKFSLKQEEEKKMGAERLYEESQEQLRQKEQQYCKQMEEKQQLELMLRNLEMELRTLKNHLKQIEEERNEAQRQLSQEQNARALQESILNTQLWRQKELTELKKTATIQPEMTDNHDQEKELLNKNQILQDEIDVLRLELDRIRARHQEEEARYLEENEALKEKTEELRKELKLNEEALTQTVFQYNAQINVSKTEIAILTSKLEHLKENKERLEIELDSFRSRLSSAVQELERCQISKNELERTLQRECDDWVRLKDKLNHDLCHLRETNNGMSQQLSKAESKANSLENELHRVTHSLREKSLQLESIQRDLSQAQCQVKELENTRQGDKDQMNKYIVKQETMQERLAQLQSENLLLRQQFEDFQNKGIIKEKVVSDVQDRFNDIFSKLRADTEKQVQMKEEINKELITKCNHLKEQVIKYEAEKVDRESSVRHLQQELADSFKKQSMSEASLEVSTRYRIDLEEDKQQLQKELDRIKSKLQESEDQYLQSERRIHDLRNALDAKEHEANVASQKLQDLLVASSGTSNAIKQLEDHIQRLEIENARLEATTTQQASRIEILQKDLQNSASVHSRLEELINGLQIAKINLEEQLNHQVQKQAICSVNAQGTHNMWEEELKSKSKLGVRLSELDREKTEVMAQLEHEKKKVKKLVELKRLVEIRLEEEMKRNRELQKECSGVRKLLKTTKKKLKEYESGDSSSQTSFHGATKNRYSESDTEIEKLRTKVEIESTRCAQLESTNHELREQLSSMKLLEKTKTQLEEDISNLKCHVQGSVIDLNQMEQYKRDVEERARQEIRQKLEEVNVFLQTQAASQETMEQIRANNYASLRNQLENRIKDLESELAKLRNRQQDNVLQKESVRSELERYKGLYSEELKMRKSFGSKLDRANEKLAEASTKLLHERHRSKSLLANSFISGSLSSSPVLETVQLGNLSSNLALNRPLSLGGAFMNPTGSVVSSKTRVEAYLAKMRTELEKNISKELEQATVELDAGSVRVSPIGSIDESSKQDQVSKATQEYLDVLKKNYMI
ncbi:ankyrin repeat domain-containing protein 26 isoform X6 [Rhineura floridana]|uniref:ankyrin repeat domain-containing protein 26 isoform X6 n=1 Tax=Rhineura floridana TaxID=261503 RepID=UPI002AC80E29|nr:ankyrin repeat domain-containing protein 26 isoform X6 [Rhineura floridana]